jgi:hypothetical protein
MTLTFGKFKGQELCSTPQWYQNWLSHQDWFKVPAQQVSYKLSAEKAYSQAHTNLLNSNYSERSVDAMFDAEKILDDAVAYDRKYYGMNAETKQAQMDWDYAEIVACNQVDEYYND